MAFIDTGVQASAFGGINPGAPSGSGVAASTGNAQSAMTGGPGANGFGSGMTNRFWVLTYYAFIIGVLVITGVIFNGKGRRG